MSSQRVNSFKAQKRQSNKSHKTIPWVNSRKYFFICVYQGNGGSKHRQDYGSSEQTIRKMEFTLLPAVFGAYEEKNAIDCGTQTTSGRSQRYQRYYAQNYMED